MYDTKGLTEHSVWGEDVTTCTPATENTISVEIVQSIPINTKSTETAKYFEFAELQIKQKAQEQHCYYAATRLPSWFRQCLDFHRQVERTTRVATMSSYFSLNLP